MRGLATAFVAAPHPPLEPEPFVPNKMVPNTAFPGHLLSPVVHLVTTLQLTQAYEGPS